MPSPFFEGIGEQVLETFKDAEKATWLSQVPASLPFDLDVIFSPRHQEKDYNGLSYGALRPVAWFKQGIIDPDYGDTLTIQGVDYKIVEINPEGHELVELVLQAP